jgi:hydrogenase/urease accessory protein HupE
MSMKRLAWTVLVSLFLAIQTAFGHPIQIEPVSVVLHPQETYLTADFSGNVQDIEQIPGYTQPLLDTATNQSQARVGDGYNDEFKKTLTQYMEDRFVLKQGETTLIGTIQEVQHVPDADITKSRFTMVMRYELPEAGRGKPLVVENTLFDYLANATTILTIGSFSRPMVSGQVETIDPSNLAVNLLTNIWAFLQMGVHHIFAGYDHILFILALLMVSPSLLNLVKTLTGFTIAHSITLVWFTLTHQGPPSRLVEILVAVSIIYVGVENLFMRSEVPTATTEGEISPPQKGFVLTPRHRFWVASSFGLIHGFAFAQELLKAGLPEGPALGWCLFSFNLGVEVAQVLIAVIAFPLLMAWKKGLEKRQKPGSLKWDTVVKAASLAVVVAGGYWLSQRLFS